MDNIINAGLIKKRPIFLAPINIGIQFGIHQQQPQQQQPQ